MNSSATMPRVVAVTACLLVAAAGLARASKSEPVPLRTPLAQLPLQFAGYDGARAPDLDPKIVDVLGVDDYISRIYRSREAGLPIGLYIGYYMSQRQGDTMHSPMNCLPGSGWQPVESARITVPHGDINRFVVERGGERMLVLYWYQSHGRVVASEYWGKIFTVVDAIRLNRTDAALVRVVVPIPPMELDGEQTAEEVGLGFVRAIFPRLDQHLPV